MDDKTLMRISFVIAVAGIAALIAAVQFAEPKMVKISDVNEKLVGQTILVNGTVDSVSIKEGNIFIKLTADKDSIDVVMFKQQAENSADAYILKKGDFLTVAGKINFYKNELEIVASSIKRL
jgi:aspartyl/asparaginyl-tRNA synthetase